MSWRVPAHPQEAASTPARRTSTPLPMATPPKLSWETRRSWRSSLRIWIKRWRRCEMWFWRGGPAADEPRASPTLPLLLCPCHPPPAGGTSLSCPPAPCPWPVGTHPAVGREPRWWPDLAPLPCAGASTETGPALAGGTRLCPAGGVGGWQLGELKGGWGGGGLCHC